MKILLSSIGSRGDVQPKLALAVELKAMGHQPVICAAPNFQAWVQSFGIDFVPIGPDLEQWTAAPRPATRPTPEQMRELARNTLVDQFRVTADAAQGCDQIVVAGMLQIAARSIAEALKIPYVYAAYCPATLPSPDYPPARMQTSYPQDLPADQNRLLWAEDQQSFNTMFGDTLNEQRAALGLAPVSNVARYITTDQPLLAADPVLGPAGVPLDDMRITQTGAWLLSDQAELPEALEAFISAGEPPIYFGFGSMRAQEQTSRILIEAARALGRRAIISQGWGNLNVIDEGSDCLSIGSVNHAKLFPRVAAIVHHGGAGTTTTAARAGKPQVIVPHNYDQFYWAHRVKTLGIGESNCTTANMNVEALVAALRECLNPQVGICASEIASRIEPHGARIAAERIVTALA